MHHQERKICCQVAGMPRLWKICPPSTPRPTGETSSLKGGSPWRGSNVPPQGTFGGFRDIFSCPSWWQSYWVATREAAAPETHRAAPSTPESPAPMPTAPMLKINAPEQGQWLSRLIVPLPLSSFFAFYFHGTLILSTERVLPRRVNTITKLFKSNREPER